MKILLSAIACHPRRGSESGVGWRAAAALSKKHTVHVLTSRGEQEGIELALATGAYPNLSFTFFGTDAPYHENRLIARLQSWQRYVHWTRQSLNVSRELAAQQHFDLAHHVTYSSWRVPSPLWQLDLPFVWGPVGGAAAYPLNFLGKLALRSAVFEVARELSNIHASYSTPLTECVCNSDAVVTSNKETFDKLLALRGRSDGMHLLFPTFFTDQQIAMFRCDPEDKPPADPIRFFAGGSIIGSKGLIFALEALTVAAQRGINWRLVVGGYGPEIPFLEQKARSWGIRERIDFHTGFAGVEYVNKLKESHAFILPSFRENAGITMLEAMLAGCVPVIVDASAQAGVVTDRCGFKIPVGTAANISEGLANAVSILARQPQQRIEMGCAASALVATSFREDSYVSRINKVYADALQRRQKKPAY
jgi:glycosyltransferase involved in cell wall biosynthesis